MFMQRQTGTGIFACNGSLGTKMTCQRQPLINTLDGVIYQGMTCTAIMRLTLMATRDLVQALMILQVLKVSQVTIILKDIQKYDGWTSLSRFWSLHELAVPSSFTSPCLQGLSELIMNLTRNSPYVYALVMTDPCFLTSPWYSIAQSIQDQAHSFHGSRGQRGPDCSQFTGLHEVGDPEILRCELNSHKLSRDTKRFRTWMALLSSNFWYQYDFLAKALAVATGPHSSFAQLSHLCIEDAPGGSRCHFVPRTFKRTCASTCWTAGPKECGAYRKRCLKNPETSMFAMLSMRNVFFLNCAVHVPAMYGAVEAL